MVSEVTEDAAIAGRNFGSFHGNYVFNNTMLNILV
jgi:hypothetical protein